MSKFKKLTGTTEKEFKIGKPGKGISITSDESGEVVIKNKNKIARILGVPNIRGSAGHSNPESIPTSGAVNDAINQKIRTVDSLSGLQLENNDYILILKQERDG